LDCFLFVEVIDDPVASDSDLVPIVHIIGADYAGGVIEDKIPVYKKGVYKSFAKFAYIRSVSLLHTESPITINIYDTSSISSSYWVRETYDHFFDHRIRSERPLFYEISLKDGINYIRYYYHMNHEEDIDIIKNSTLIQVVGDYELYDPTGIQVTVIDQIVPYINNKLLIRSGNKIYICDKREEYTDLFLEYKGYSPSPEGYLYLESGATSRLVIDSGTSGSATNSVTFFDATKTWADDSLVGMCLQVNGYEYLITANTTNTITVSANHQWYVDLTIAVPSPANYVIKAMPFSFSPERFLGIKQPQRAKIIFKHETGLKLIFDGTKFIEYSNDIWLPNQIVDSETDFNFQRYSSFLPFSGNYLVELEIDYVAGAERDTEIFKTIITIGRKNAYCEIDLSSIGNITDIYIDNGYLKVLTDNNKKYIGRFLYDYMVVDFESKQLMLFESYDEVDVTCNLKIPAILLINSCRLGFDRRKISSP